MIEWLLSHSKLPQTWWQPSLQYWGYHKLKTSFESIEKISNRLQVRKLPERDCLNTKVSFFTKTLLKAGFVLHPVHCAKPPSAASLLLPTRTRNECSETKPRKTIGDARGSIKLFLFKVFKMSYLVGGGGKNELAQSYLHLFMFPEQISCGAGAFIGSGYNFRTSTNVGSSAERRIYRWTDTF